MKKEPVLIVMSVLATLQILTAGSALADVVGKDVAALAVLVVAAIQAGVQFYVRGQVTTNDNVAAVVEESKVVAGAAQVSSAEEGEPVDVTPRDFDRGGVLPKGRSVVTNNTDEPEPLG